jgi:VanZ family protein
MKREFVILIVWMLVLWGLLLAPIGEEGIASDLGFKHWDKIAHFCLFGVTGFVGAFAASFFRTLRSRILFAMILGLFLAVCTEGAQSLIGFRNGSPYDLLADIAGLLAALLLYALLYRRRIGNSFFRF